MWEFFKKVYKSLGVSDHPKLGWTVIGLASVIAFNIWVGDSGLFDGIDIVRKWVGDNKVLTSIVLLAVCIGTGFYRDLRKSINDLQEKK